MVDSDAVVLSGGYRNAVTRRRAGRGFVIEKWYAEDAGPPNPMYPNLPASEAAALRVLGPLGLAPVLVDAGAGHLVYRYVAGPTWRPGRLASVQSVAGLLHRVHHVRPPDGLRALLRCGADAVAHGDAMLSDVSGHGQLVDVARSIRPPSPSRRPPERPALVHTDCGPGNIVRARTGPVLIDWQCPGVGDAVEDLVCFLSPAMMVLYGCRPHSTAAVRSFLAAYPDSQTVERYRRDAGAWRYRIAGYCVWRAARLADTDPVVADRYRRALAAEVGHGSRSESRR